MSSTTRADFAVAGLAVMGRNLALNVADKGFRVAVWNRDPSVVPRVVAENPAQRLVGTTRLTELVASLSTPRRLLLMVKAGEPVDAMLGQLAPLLAPGDIVIDGGNSWFLDTRRREQELRGRGLRFVGMGVSGGEAGARHGPSLMPGGDPAAYRELLPILEAIAARTESGPCVTHCGADGAGHFVKMVHNGIEYADMQLIAEAYDLLRRDVGLGAAELAEVFAAWNRGPLASYLIEITARIFTVRDAETQQPLVDLVLDTAGQKGTGKWTVQAALELGVAVPAIAAAVDARVLSSQKAARLAAAAALPPAAVKRARGAAKTRIAQVEAALYAAKICAYAQGMALIAKGAKTYGWQVNLREIARIWKGGCIIRAKLLDAIMHAFKRDPALANLVLDPDLSRKVRRAEKRWRATAARAQQAGIPVPALSASLGWFDTMRAAELPHNLLQAQRDAFGAHGYERRDKPDLGSVHTDWL
jgi:6-phosphogluconate dehydrogenase